MGATSGLPVNSVTLSSTHKSSDVEFEPTNSARYYVCYPMRSATCAPYAKASYPASGDAIDAAWLQSVRTAGAE